MVIVFDLVVVRGCGGNNYTIPTYIRLIANILYTRARTNYSVAMKNSTLTLCSVRLTINRVI